MPKLSLQTKQIRHRKKRKNPISQSITYHICPECEVEFQCTKIRNKTDKCECIQVGKNKC